MKRVLATLAVLLMPAIIFALPKSPSWAPGCSENLQEAGPYVKAEVSLIQTEIGEETPGDMKVREWLSLRDRLNVAAQKDRYVNLMATESYFLPGLAQFQLGDTASGAGFLALHLGVVAGTLVAAYYLLPSDLRFDKLDYFGDSASTIEDRWGNHSFTDYLPSIGALCAGIVAGQLVKHWASEHAREEATQAVDREKVTFTPRIGVGFMGFDLRY
jgi:hypothetical protein